MEHATEIFGQLMASGKLTATSLLARAISISHISVDPASIALTGGNMSLIRELGSIMIRPLALCAGVAHTYTARDAAGTLVGYTIFCLPGQLANST